MFDYTVRFNNGDEKIGACDELSFLDEFVNEHVKYIIVSSKDGNYVREWTRSDGWCELVVDGKCMVF